MIFHIDRNLDVKIHEAAFRAHDFLKTLKHEDTKKLAPFTYYDEFRDPWVQIVARLAEGPVYPIKAWYPWNRWTKAIATTFGDGAIHINARKIHLFEVHDYVNTLTHETMHNLGFGHGNNYFTKEKARSVPYAIGALAEAWSRAR